MRLCFVCNEYPPATHGGIGTFVQNLARELVSRGHEIYAIGYDASVQADRTENDCGVTVLRLKLPKLPKVRIGRFFLDPNVFSSRIRLSKRLDELVQEHKIDLVESFDWNGPLWYAPKCPLIVRMHGANTAYAFFEQKQPSRLTQYFERKNILMADHLVAVSYHMRDITLKTFKLEHIPCRVIYNGVDTELFSPPRAVASGQRVLYVGRVHPRKGIHELFAAWEIVSLSCPDTKLSIVGGKLANGEFEHYLAGKTIDRDSIEIIGFVPHDQLVSWYQSAAVCVFPSKAEAFGLTCAEAMSCGAAVVMTSLASGPELIEHEKSGLLADPSDSHEFANAIIRLLIDSDLASNLGKNARERAFERFNHDNLVDQNLALYKDALQDVSAN